MNDKIDNILFWTFISIVVIFGIILTILVIDFKNDYECSTTDDINWFIEHNCERYFK